MKNQAKTIVFSGVCLRFRNQISERGLLAAPGTVFLTDVGALSQNVPDSTRISHRLERDIVLRTPRIRSCGAICGNSAG
jgi:hypothetical protein